MKMRVTLLSLLAVGLSAVAHATTYELTVSGLSSVEGSIDGGLQKYGSGPGIATPFTVSYLTNESSFTSDDNGVGYNLQLKGATINGHQVTELDGSDTLEFGLYVFTKPESFYHANSINGLWDDPNGQITVFSIAGPNLISGDGFPDFNNIDLANATDQNTIALSYNLDIVDPNNPLTPGGSLSGKVTGLSIRAVPEPASFAFLGFGALALVRRRRN